MLKELGAFIERLQDELEVRGVHRSEEAVQIEIKCRTIGERIILDQEIERQVKVGYYRGLAFNERVIRHEFPRLLTYRGRLSASPMRNRRG